MQGHQSQEVLAGWSWILNFDEKHPFEFFCLMQQHADNAVKESKNKRFTASKIAKSSSTLFMVPW